MDGANADSDHSMTWEDFFGSTTDLTPTLIGIYDSLLEPAKPPKAEPNRFGFTAKDARNDPPLDLIPSSPPKPPKRSPKAHSKTITPKTNVKIEGSPPKDPAKFAGSVKLPGLASLNRSSLYPSRNVEKIVESDKKGAMDTNIDVSVNKCSLSSSESSVLFKHNTYKYSSLQVRNVKNEVPKKSVLDAVAPSNSGFDNLSPNVKRMISSATETTNNPLKFQKKTLNVGRSSARGFKLSNIPLVGATSKISQSGVDILPSVEIYDQPCAVKAVAKPTNSEEDIKVANESPTKHVVDIKPEFRLDSDLNAMYDVPTNKRAIYDVPAANAKAAFDSLSLPYIDQSIELSITSNDREFDTKLSSKDNSPLKPDLPKTSTPENSPKKTAIAVRDVGTNSLHRKDVLNKSDSPSKQLPKTGPYPEAIGSTGNLKLCVVPEKDPTRLKPPTLEVSRPLSLSSIASSSSTSSSGVQNKGGVNSAYLASIESLDDHSDADMISANGSNNFVNSTGMLNTSISEEIQQTNIPGLPHVEETPGLSQLERVCAEIVQTEHVYVEDLRQVVEGYLHVWRRDGTFSEEELADLFNNVEHIYEFNRELCSELNTCRLDASSIARCFVENTSGFGVYTSYCTGYPRTMERLATLASCRDSARAFRERQVELGHALPLASYLLKPVQRILKYHLLLQNLVKQCASRDTEYAFLKMTGIAQHIDDMKRRHEHAVRVQEIQSLLYGWNGPDLTTYGELCAEGTFRVFGAKAMRHAFLFDKMLLLTKNREDGILAYKSHIMCNNLMLVESIDGAPLSFHVIPWDAPRAQLTLQARSMRHKREWTLLLKRVILENYNAVIPSHARQLVMELGQNKTDDDRLLAEKSHNLITQASMRKQLSAPEYLEKRKVERERRKLFEDGTRERVKKTNRKNTVPIITTETQEACDCVQVSAEKGIDYTCDSCYIDLCSDCDTELSKKDKIGKEETCNCKINDPLLNPNNEKCPECDRSLHYIDAGSTEQLERKQSCCKCSDFESSQESVGKDFISPLNKTRGYHSSDNIVSYTDKNKSKEDFGDINNSSYTNVRNIRKTCLKCAKIKENIVVVDSSTLRVRKSRCNELQNFRTDTLRSKSKDDPQRSKLSKISTWRRKSEPGLQQNGVNMSGALTKKINFEYNENEKTIDVCKGHEKIEFECRNCGSNRITRKDRPNEGLILSDPELDMRKFGATSCNKANVLEVKMYNSKNLPKKISKLKKSRAKGLRFGSDTTAKFYADFSTDVSTENILHITESSDSINKIDKAKPDENIATDNVCISKDADIDDEMYKKLIEKTDSFKKNELEKVKYMNQQKVINEGSECENEKIIEPEVRHPNDDVTGSGEDSEKPLEQIISQLLMENREFQKLLKKHQLRNSAQRRHQRLLKSHSNPEQVIAARSREQIKLKPKYGRQTSENVGLIEPKDVCLLSPPNEVDDCSDDDHIYEKLREDVKYDRNSLSSKSKSIEQISPKVLRPRRLSSPPTSQPQISDLEQNQRLSAHESDYVYLSFEKLKAGHNEEIDEIYDVPSSVINKVNIPDSPVKIQTDYYVLVENNASKANSEKVETEQLYDNVVDVCRREKEQNVTSTTGEYMPMSPTQLNPNTPEIWLSRQKEHFNVSRDRKSGSLPRSFQVVTSSSDENNLSSFKSKPNGSNKTYLNKDGKVLSIDRPFTIASDKSEISYDDMEALMNDDDILKFNKNTSKSFFETDISENISQSTLELEKEIDRCYKNNFEQIGLQSDTNVNLLAASQPNLDISANSASEMFGPGKNNTNSPKQDANVVHPEHKIYKPTTNLLSLKGVLSRFKSKTPTKNVSDEVTPQDINANDHSTPESTKSELKSPTSMEKRSALNPRSYSKNLLQRFRSIIGDEQPDDNQNKLDLHSTNNEMVKLQNNFGKTDIKVVITSTEVYPSSSTVQSQSNDLSKSFCEQTTLSESQNEKNNLEILSHSCDNLKKNPSQLFRTNYEKSVSLVSHISNTTASNSSPTKSNNGSYPNLHKLPIYKQGSKHLGARIAQSDYVDPMTLFIGDSKSDLNNVNILINKNALRPDSLFSNSSFVTTSSEGTYQSDQQNKSSNDNSVFRDRRNSAQQDSKLRQMSADSSMLMHSDESFYEKSFEKIEHIKDQEMFRDSAVYSDQEDHDDTKLNAAKTNNVKRQISRLDTIKRNCTLKSVEQVESHSFTKQRQSKGSIHTSISYANTIKSQLSQTDRQSTDRKFTQSIENTINKQQKVAPPVPAKPKLSTNVLSGSNEKPFIKPRNFTIRKSNNSLTSNEQSSSTESVDMRTIKRNTIVKPINSRSESTPYSEPVSNTASEAVNDKLQPGSESDDIELRRTLSENTEKLMDKAESKAKVGNEANIDTHPAEKLKPAQSNIQIKRLSFERTSLDSISRRSKSVSAEANKRSSAEIPKLVSKSVQERRLEIESITQNQTSPSIQKNTTNAKPKQLLKPKPISTKTASFERSISDSGRNSKQNIRTFSIDNSDIPKAENSINPEENETHSSVGESSTTNDETEDLTSKESWVKQIVNKFQ